MKLFATALAAAFVLTLALDSTAQTAGSYSLYGSGCAGSGQVGGGFVLPSGYANKFGTSNNRFPIGSANMRYMQVHEASEFTNGVTPVRGFNFRNRSTMATPAYTLTMTIKVGYTNKTSASLDPTFANNWTGVPATTAFTGTWNVKALAATSNPQSWGIKVPFKTPFFYLRARGNFLWECQNTTAALTPYVYYDAVRGSAATPIKAARMWNTTSPTAATGTVAANYSLSMQIEGAIGGGAIVQLKNTGVPVINKSFSVDFSGAVRNSAAILWLGAQRLNVSLSPVLPGCTLLSSLDVLLGGVATGSNGTGSMMFALPNDRQLIGLGYYNQWMIVDAAANGLGVVLSNGGAARIGG